jgi:hypothetical protein
LPALASAKKRAYTIKCASNAKQIALGFNMYAQDYGQALPVALIQNTNIAPLYTTAVMPYLTAGLKTATSNQLAFMCPALSAMYPSTNIPDGYGANQHLSWPDDGHANAGGLKHPWKLTQITRPTESILLGDTYSLYLSKPSIQNHVDCQGMPGSFGDSPNQPLVHSGLANLIYADGHVAAAKLNVVAMLCSAKSHGGNSANGNIYDFVR